MLSGTRLSLALLCAALLLGLVPALASAAPRTASAIGVTDVQGERVRVEVFVQVKAGETAREATGRALKQQDARRVSSAQAADPGGPGFTGLVWDVLPVVQSYNPAGERVDTQAALAATQSSWSSVTGSAFGMSFGGITSRCPSLVEECPGAQALDAQNDVGWQALSPGTLGVTWSTLSSDEADMALNGNVAWSSGCGPVSGRYDVQTVLLHENGHVAGLDHATSTSSIMYPSYQAANCALGALDQDAIRTLYPGA
jgi:Matrixin